MKTIYCKRILPLLCLALLPALLSGCVFVGFGHPVTRGNGVIEKRDLTPGEFTGIDVGGGMELVYTKGDVYKVEMETDENLFDKINVTIRNDTLHIDQQITFNVNPTTAVLYVTAPTLENVRISGGVKFDFEDAIEATNLDVRISGAASGLLLADVDSLKIDASGASDFDVEGRADDVEIRLSGAGKIDAEHLISKTAELTISGAGELAVTCEDELDARISGAGSIRYYGDPHVSRNISGAGSIIQGKN